MVRKRATDCSLGSGRSVDDGGKHTGLQEQKYEVISESG